MRTSVKTLAAGVVMVGISAFGAINAALASGHNGSQNHNENRQDRGHGRVEHKDHDDGRCHNCCHEGCDDCCNEPCNDHGCNNYGCDDPTRYHMGGSSYGPPGTPENPTKPSRFHMGGSSYGPPGTPENPSKPSKPIPIYMGGSSYGPPGTPENPSKPSKPTRIHMG